MFSALGVEVAGQRAERLADLRLPPKQRNQIQSELRTRSLAVFASQQDGRRRRNRPRRLLHRPDGRPDGGEKVPELKILALTCGAQPCYCSPRQTEEFITLWQLHHGCLLSREIEVMGSISCDSHNRSLH